MRNLFKDSRGMTLVEVIISIMIVALIAIAVLTAITQGAILISRSDEIYTASILAQARIDTLKKFDFANIPYTAPEIDVPIDIDGDGEVDFFRTTAVTQNFNGFSDLVTVKVSVDRADEASPAGHPITMETVFADI